MAGYGDNEGFDTWLAANGYELPEDGKTSDVLRERGSQYIDAVYGPRFVGVPTAGAEQERAWPRTGAVVYGSTLATTLTPLAVVNASYRAAYAEAVKPGILSVIEVPSRRVKRQKAEGIEREFFEPKLTDMLASAVPLVSDIEGALAPYLMPADANGLFLFSVGGCHDDRSC